MDQTINLNHSLQNEMCNILEFYWKLYSQFLKISNNFFFHKIYYFRFVTQKTNTLIKYRKFEKVFRDFEWYKVN
jgi:hypothetical protein